jgi:dimethylhistidine N-methyltransferase
VTGCEFDILQNQKEVIWRHIAKDSHPFKLVELGAGDGTKTEVLLKYFYSKEVPFTYVPVDVSLAVLEELKQRLNKSIPGLNILLENKLYNEALDELKNDHAERKLIMFLGANIGNFNIQEAILFVRKLRVSMNESDLLLIGFDLKKDPRLIQAAYDDSECITREFNLNLLSRINRELGGQFKTETFSHYPYYDPETGVTKSFLVSKVDQDVWIEAFEKEFHFDKNEIIHTEVSQKYDMKMIRNLAVQSGLEIVDILYDKKEYFADVMFKVKT